jgi:hypothetical protein
VHTTQFSEILIQRFVNFLSLLSDNDNLNGRTTKAHSATMKLNISHPSNGSQKLIEIEDERKLRVFMDKRVCEAPRFPEEAGLL